MLLPNKSNVVAAGRARPGARRPVLDPLHLIARIGRGIGRNHDDLERAAGAAASDLQLR